MSVVEHRGRGMVACPTCGGALERAADQAIECRRCRRRVELFEIVASDEVVVE